MAKKRPHDTSDVSSDDVATPHEDNHDHQTEPQPSHAPGHPLMKEIQSHLSQRDELARKLDEEIEAMEQKLAEMRETAALLKPGNIGDSKKQEKTKKPKPKPTKDEKAGSMSSSDHGSATDE